MIIYPYGYGGQKDDFSFKISFLTTLKQTKNYVGYSIITQ